MRFNRMLHHNIYLKYLLIIGISSQVVSAASYLRDRNSKKTDIFDPTSPQLIEALQSVDDRQKRSSDFLALMPESGEEHDPLSEKLFRVQNERSIKEEGNTNDDVLELSEELDDEDALSSLGIRRKRMAMRGHEKRDHGHGGRGGGGPRRSKEKEHMKKGSHEKRRGGSKERRCGGRKKKGSKEKRSSRERPDCSTSTSTTITTSPTTSSTSTTATSSTATSSSTTSTSVTKTTTPPSSSTSSSTKQSSTRPTSTRPS